VLLLAAGLTINPLFEVAVLARQRWQTDLFVQLRQICTLWACVRIEHRLVPRKASAVRCLRINVRKADVEVSGLALWILVVLIHLLVPHHALLDLSQQNHIQCWPELFGRRVYELNIGTINTQSRNGQIGAGNIFQTDYRTLVIDIRIAWCCECHAHSLRLGPYLGLDLMTYWTYRPTGISNNGFNSTYF
jgi:hypothetical protein